MLCSPNETFLPMYIMEVLLILFMFFVLNSHVHHWNQINGTLQPWFQQMTGSCYCQHQMSISSEKSRARSLIILLICIFGNDIHFAENLCLLPCY
uniref:Uncharacterized protein n=1 Tax=Arundo donax TaxID=35708 RepID=A0A0A9BIV1_ARUDO